MAGAVLWEGVKKVGEKRNQKAGSSQGNLTASIYIPTLSATPAETETVMRRSRIADPL